MPPASTARSPIWPVCANVRRSWPSASWSSCSRSRAFRRSGFFGKFAVFAAALKLNGLAGWAGWLALFAIGMSAVGLYYYLLILKHAVVAPGRADATPIKVPLAAATALLIAAGLILVLGLFPSIVLQATS